MTFKLSSLLKATTLLFLLQACGSQNDATLSSTDAPLDERPLLVTMGGNNSCKTDQQNRQSSPYGHELFRSAQQRILKNKKLMQLNWRYISSCYTDTDSVTYVTSEAPNEFKTVRRSVFEALVKDAALRSKASFLAGHSYGGWLAMKVGHHMFQNGIRPEQNVSLFTVDPISREYCSYSSPFGCQEAPQDFSASALRDINEVSRAWLNFYQTNTWYLHSDEIAEADENLEIDTSHTEIDSDVEVWDRIEQTVRAAF